MVPLVTVVLIAQSLLCCSPSFFVALSVLDVLLSQLLLCCPCQEMAIRVGGVEALYGDVRGLLAGRMERVRGRGVHFLIN